MKTSLNLFLSIPLLVAAAACGSSSSGTAGVGGSGGGGGEGGSGGQAGTGGTGGQAGMGGSGGQAGMGGSGGQAGTGGTGGITASTCHPSIPPLLSDWGLFADIRHQVPADDVIPFDVTSPLFTDYALKHRFVTLRDGGHIEYSQNERWQSPVGTIYVKTFAYPPNLLDPETDGLEQLVETRLMVHVAAEDDRLGCQGAPSCWQPHVYVYDAADMTDAVCESGGKTVSITYTNPLGECSIDQSPCASDEDCGGGACDHPQESVPDYGIPSNGACRRCHGVDPTRTLGPSTGMLNRGNDYQGVPVANQIDQLYALGMLAPEPPPNPNDRTTYVNPVLHTEICQTPLCYHEAARAYFQSNCSHCHAPDGEAAGTGLFLDYATMNPVDVSVERFKTWGVCKLPTSAGGVRNCPGGKVDVVPGEPDGSILLCRINSITPGEMMAPLGRSLVDEPGYNVIRQWIADLPILFPDIPRCSTEGAGGTGGAEL